MRWRLGLLLGKMAENSKMLLPQLGEPVPGMHGDAMATKIG